MGNMELIKGLQDSPRMELRLKKDNIPRESQLPCKNIITDLIYSVNDRFPALQVGSPISLYSRNPSMSAVIDAAPRLTRELDMSHEVAPESR